MSIRVAWTSPEQGEFDCEAGSCESGRQVLTRLPERSPAEQRHDFITHRRSLTAHAVRTVTTSVRDLAEIATGRTDRQRMTYIPGTATSTGTSSWVAIGV